jgi:translation initiation factor eIF-2B subunit beta
MFHSLGLNRSGGLGDWTVWIYSMDEIQSFKMSRRLTFFSDEAKEDREDGSDTTSQAGGSPRPEHADSISIRVEGAPPTFSPLRNESTTSPDPNEDVNGDDVFGSSQPSRPALGTSHQSYAAKMGVPVQQSMFNLLSATPSPSATPTNPGSPVNAASLAHRISSTAKDLKAEVISGVEEIM